MAINTLIQKVKNKLYWFKKYRYPEWQNKLQHYGLLYLLCKPMVLTQKSAMIIAPHQDDESFGCAGVIAMKREQNIPVDVVFVTNGEASHNWHPQFKGGKITPIRKQEALTALRILGVEPDHIHFLEQPDGKLKYNEATHQQVIEKLARLIQIVQPGEIYVTHRQDRSADHEASYELTQQAIAASGLDVDLFQYYIWLLWKTYIFREVQWQDLVGAYRLSIASVLDKKKQAVKTYRSQYLPIQGGGTLLPPGFLNRFFLPYEVFFKL